MCGPTGVVLLSAVTTVFMRAESAAVMQLCRGKCPYHSYDAGKMCSVTHLCGSPCYHASPILFSISFMMY